MGRRVPEHAERTLDQIGKPTLFALLALRGKGIDGQHGKIAHQGSIYQVCTVIRQAGF